MPHRTGAEITYVVRYADGSTALFRIDRWTVKTGDHIARTVARERQDVGQLPRGEIVSVERAPFHQQS